MMDFSAVFAEAHVFLRGTVYTLVVSALSVVVGFVIALPVCAARISQSLILQRAAALYVSFWRGVPLLVLLLLVFYALPYIGLEFPPMVAAVIALSLCTAAYQAEILRGGLIAIPQGQREAARALGLTRWQVRLQVELPQALRIVMPALVSDVMLVVKSSALVSVVGVLDLTRASQNLAASSFRPFEAYLAALLIYLVINVLISQAGHHLELRLAVGHKRFRL